MKKRKMKINKSFFVWGVLVGTLSFLMMLFDYLTVNRLDISFAPLEPKLFIVLVGIGLFIKVRLFLQEAKGPKLFLKVFLVGVSFSFLSGLIWAVLSSIFVFVNPEYVQVMLLEASKKVTSPINAAESVGVRFGAELIYSSLGQFISKVVIALIIGAIFSLIVTLIYTNTKINSKSTAG